MFRRMQKALQKLGEDNSDGESPKSVPNTKGDTSKSNVEDEYDGDDPAEEVEGEDNEEEAERGEEGEREEEEEEEEAEGEEQAEDEEPMEDVGEGEYTEGGEEDEGEEGEGEEDEDEEESEGGEGEEYAEDQEGTVQVIQVVEVVQEAPPGISRTLSDPVTQTEQDQVEDKKHPPIKIYNPVTEEWSPKHAVIDTGCDDDWISQSTALQLNLTITPLVDPPKMTTFSGEPMKPVGQTMVTWEATSTGKTEDTLAYIAENGPFDFLLGSNFYWGKGGESYFDEPVEILRMSKKPTEDETSEMRATHKRRVQVGMAAATARQQATKEENTRLRNSVPQQSVSEEGDGEED